MNVTRRCFAGAVSLRPALSASACRVAALDYGPAETMLALDVALIAIPDVPGRAPWVVEPSLPSSVASLGADQEVNLELLASLEAVGAKWKPLGPIGQPTTKECESLSGSARTRQTLVPDLIRTTPFLDDLDPILTRIAPCERLAIYQDGGPGPFVAGVRFLVFLARKKTTSSRSTRHRERSVGHAC